MARQIENAVLADQFEQRILHGRQVVGELLSAKMCGFRNLTPSTLPGEPGIYVITTDSGEILRAGRTENQGLCDRIYRNHLMGSQAGNLRAQLVKDGTVADLKEAKQWIRQNCLVQFLRKNRLDDKSIKMKWAEHFMLAVLRPRFSN